MTHPDDYPTEIRPAYEPTPVKPRKTGRLLVAAVVVLAIAGGAAGAAYALGERAGKPGGETLSAEGTCLVLVPALGRVVELYNELLQKGLLSDTQHAEAEQLRARLEPLATTGHEPWRADIEVQRKTAEFMVTNRVTDPVIVRESGLRLLNACAEYAR